MRNSEAIEASRYRRQMSLNEMSLLVGTELGVSGWYQIDQDGSINLRRARTTGNGSMLTANVRAARVLLERRLRMAFSRYRCWRRLDGGLDRGLGTATLNYGIERARFINPVRAGARIRNRIKLLAWMKSPAAFGHDREHDRDRG